MRLQVIIKFETPLEDRWIVGIFKVEAFVRDHPPFIVFWSSCAASAGQERQHSADCFELQPAA